MTELGTAIRSLVIHEPMLVIRTGPLAMLKYQTNTTAFSCPEGVLLDSPMPRTGVMVREEVESGTAIPISFIR